jgi:Transposase DDE domain
MPRYPKEARSLAFDSLMGMLSDQFDRVPDHRAANVTYSLSDMLRGAFAMFSLKSPSLLAFKEQTRAEQKNLATIYRLGAIPGDTQMRAGLDPVDPAVFRGVFPALIGRLKQAGVLKEYEYWRDHVIVSMDGVEHFCSAKVHCPQCTTRKLRDGTMSYRHAGLAAVLVHPDHEEVFPLDFEPILNADGAAKNDCERNAAKRLCESLHDRYPDLKMLVVEDALYANAPHIRQIAGYGWSYILSVKPDSHASLVRQFEGREASGQVATLETTDARGVRYRYAWTSGLCLNDSAIDVTVNYLRCERTDRTGKKTIWTWVTNLAFTKATVEKVARAGRARWKIENETFNTLKNQGYHFEHNYGHGTQNLASVLALLMFLAFAVDQIIQHAWDLFGQVRAGLSTKVKLWERLRGVFAVLTFPTMTHLYRFLLAQIE